MRIYICMYVCTTMKLVSAILIQDFNLFILFMYVCTVCMFVCIVYVILHLKPYAYVCIYVCNYVYGCICVRVSIEISFVAL